MALCVRSACVRRGPAESCVTMLARRRAAQLPVQLSEQVPLDQIHSLSNQHRAANPNQHRAANGQTCTMSS